MAYIFQFKRGKASTWKEKNILLEAGEPGFEIDTGRLKIGDGIRPWNELTYSDGTGSLSPDGESLAIEDNGVLTIYGYKDAEVGQIPIKTSKGLSWIMLNEVAKTGDIKDLKQTETLELYGGSATDVM